jgi:hypothetical protein
LLADDDELNKWYPLGKLTKIQPEAVQKFEAKIYKRKAKDIELKKKILPSLFKEEYVYNCIYKINNIYIIITLTNFNFYKIPYFFIH